MGELDKSTNNYELKKTTPEFGVVFSALYLHQYPLVICDYYLATLALVLMHRVQAFTRWPSKTAYCRFGSKRRIEARMEWERLMVRE